MAKTPSQQLQDFLKKVDRAAFRARRRQDIADFVAEVVVRRTRLGFGVARTGARREKLIPLSDSYKKVRGKSRLDGTTSPSKSNLTFTGELLRSIEGKLSAKGFIVKPTGSRGGGLTNEELAGFLEQQGRPFLNLGKGDIKQIVIELEDAIERELRKLK